MWRHPWNRFFFSILFVLVAVSASSMPILMDQYNEHPLALAQNRDKCVICHVNSDGSGELTAFGKKYDRANLQLTDALIVEYPNLFGGDGVAAGESANTAVGADAEVMVPGNEPFDARKYYLAECTECHGKYGDGDPFQGVPAFATTTWIEERSMNTKELVDIILNGKNKMIGHAGKITAQDAHEMLALIRQIAEKYAE